MLRATLCLLLFAASPIGTIAAADDLEDLEAARAAQGNDNLGKALEIALPSAEKGNPAAQVLVGDLFWDGRGIGRDRAKSVAWYRKAAGKGNAVAMLRLARAYGDDAGDGVERSYKTAVDWCRQAVAKGSARAMGELGRFFLRGRGVKKDRAKAREWFEKGAAKDDGFSHFQLGELDTDRKRALESYRKAASLGYARGYTRIGDAHFVKGGTDRVEAVRWYRRAADGNDAEARRKLGLCYINGWGVPKDMVQARAFLRMAGSQGDKEAKDLLVDLGKPIHGRITDSKYLGDNLARIFIDKGTLDGVRKRARGYVKGVRGKFEVKKVWQRRCMAEIRTSVNAIRTSTGRVTIER